MHVYCKLIRLWPTSQETRWPNIGIYHQLGVNQLFADGHAQMFKSGGADEEEARAIYWDQTAYGSNECLWDR